MLPLLRLTISELSIIISELYIFLFPRGYLLFAAGCHFMGGNIVLLDRGLYFFSNKSLLNLNYNRKIWLIILMWSICSGIGGYIGVIMGILKVNLKGAVLASVGWSLIISQVIRYFKQ